MKIIVDKDQIEKALKVLDSQQLKTEDGKNKGLFDAYDVGFLLGTMEFILNEAETEEEYFRTKG